VAENTSVLPARKGKVDIPAILAMMEGRKRRAWSWSNRFAATAAGARDRERADSKGLPEKGGSCVPRVRFALASMLF